MTAVNEAQPTPDELAALFGFSLDELALNRAGQFSDRQRQTLFFMSVGYLVRGLALVVLTVVLAAAVAETIHTRWQITGFALLSLLIVGMVGLWLRAAYLVRFPHVETITGTLRRGSDDWHPSIFAGTVELRV
jgi:ABC-type proline/glycine betaine transport system permease subunit